MSANKEKVYQIDHFLRRQAPIWLDPNTNMWNIAKLSKRAKVTVANISFDGMHDLLRDAAKDFILTQILYNRLGIGACQLYYRVLLKLSVDLWETNPSCVGSIHFELAAARMQREWSRGTAVRYIAGLNRFAKWYSGAAGVPILTVRRQNRIITTGFFGDEESKSSKLLSDSVIAQLLATAKRDDLSLRDQFYFAVFAISITTGLRIEEVLTLRRECVVIEGGATLVLNTPAKNGKLTPKVVHPLLCDVFLDAVAFIQEKTQAACAQAKLMAEMRPHDWRRLLNNGTSEQVRYFLQRELHRWYQKHENRVIDPDYAYYQVDGTWIHISAYLRKHRGNVSAISRDLGIARPTVNTLIHQVSAGGKGKFFLGNRSIASSRGFDTDRRFFSLLAFKEISGITVTPQHRHGQTIKETIDEARVAHISGIAVTAPKRNLDWEEAFRFSDVLRTEVGSDDIAIRLQDALFVIFEDQLSVSHTEKDNWVTYVSASMVNHWLTGYTRDRGTGKPSDSMCSRFSITEPETGEIASFEVHDFRHWLTTAYLNGGFTQTQVATLFNRKAPITNAVYDQTSSAVRRERLKEAVSDGRLSGAATEIYAKLAEENRDLASGYLEAAMRFYHPMPHGICRLNWSSEACPHMLSCFNCGENDAGDVMPCEFLLIDPTNENQIEEIKRIQRDARSKMTILEEMSARGSSQYVASARIDRSIETILNSVKD